ncbi:MAG: bacteriocin transport accessory protein [Lachnospiraceae bacterium]|nr:bacteriocin transport accessory protein [Lachnospiraceae bacterium]
MKKLGVLGLSIIMVMGLAACGKDKTSDKDQTTVATTEATTEAAVEITDSLEIFNTVWATYGEDEKFSIAGGDYNNSVMDAPGKFNVTDVESLDAMLGVPATAAAYIDDAASVMHMMNANTFTAGAYRVTDSANQQAFCDSLKDNIMNRQWMCGFPDTLIIVSIGENYVVSAFGNGEIIETFKTKVTAEYPMATVVYEESLAQ